MIAIRSKIPIGITAESLLRQQFEIYSTNIILCVGSWKMADIAKRIYSDINFSKMENSNWIWYSVEKQLVLIDNYHPGAYKSNEEKYDTLIEHFQRFLGLKLFDL